MSVTESFWTSYLAEIYLIYGVAFYFLAFAIYMQPRQQKLLAFGADLIWLGRFGLLHGSTEFYDAWLLLSEVAHPVHSVIAQGVSVFSYAMLMIFAGNAIARFYPLPLLRLAAVYPFLIIIALAFWSWPESLSDDAWLRLLLGFPAAAGAGIALLIGAVTLRQTPDTQQFFPPLSIAGGAFFLYAVLTGLVSQQGLVLGETQLLQLVGLPVQLLRAVCALVAAAAIGHLLLRVNETQFHNEHQALAQAKRLNANLEDQIAQRTLELAKRNRQLEREVAEKNNAELNLQQSQALLQRAQAVGQIGSWHFDAKQQGLQWSDETYRIFGLDLDTPVNYSTFLSFVHPEDRELVDQTWRLAQQAQHYDLEHRILVQGEVKWVRERAELVFDRQGYLLTGLGTVQNISARKQAELQLKETIHELALAEQQQRDLRLTAEFEQGRMAALLSAMSIGILFEDQAGQIEYVNQAFYNLWAIPENLDLTNLPSQHVLEHSTHRFARPGHASRHILRVLDTHEISERFELELADGRILTQLSYPVIAQEGHGIGRLWIYEDITHQRQTAEQLLYLAEHDALTGLCNRRHFEQQLTQVITAERRLERKFALLYFDLDEFKHINDSFGHRAGDTVLVRIASEVAALVCDADVFARLGGDEFAIITHLQPGDDTQELPRRISRAISALSFRFRGSNLRITCSIGIALFPEHGKTLDSLVAHADTAMYQAKQQGKNTWAVYDPGRDYSSAMVERMTWQRRIEQALHEDLFELYFQGIFTSDTQQLVHFEVLLRMRDRQQPDSILLPGQFIPVAEHSGQILAIDRWVLLHSVMLLQQHPQLPALAVNLSGRSFDDPELPDFIDQLLDQHKVAPSRLIIELTETEAVSDIKDAQRFIERIKRTGCKVCLDDFGSGFSTFAYLKYLDVDILKVDGLFIRDLPNNHENQVFVKAMTGIARGLDKEILAEFVEDAATLAMLNDMGVKLVQGYYLSRPSPDFAAFLPR
ncbi:MAG: EAL domain-containing protein [Methylococcales bacterium]|nr:EAL domain-containing protein [Methylococcales bacterium]